MKRLLLTISLITGTIAAYTSCSEQEQAPEIIKVESVSINQEDITLTEGESVTLTATVLPEGAADNTVAWSSSDESVVMVSSSGKVMAFSLGKAAVTAKAGDKSDFITVTVVAKRIPVSGISLNPSEITMKVGESQVIKADVTPQDATDKSVTWESSNPEVASVDNGTVLGLKPGSVTITATTVDGAKTADCAVTIKSNLSPSVTVDADHISAVSVVLHGKANLENSVSSDLMVGFQYSTSSGILPSNSLTIEASEADSQYNYSAVIAGLDPSTKYYYRSVVRQKGTDTYGETKEFTTKDVTSMLETKDANAIEATKATLHAKLDLSDVAYSSLAYGFFWGGAEAVQDTDFKCTEIKDNAISAELMSLSYNTQYWYKAYVKLDDQTFYGQIKTFTTDVVLVESISLDKNEYTIPAFGSTITLTATVLPSDATDKSVEWSSSNDAVATVNQVGTVTAISNGTAIIKAEAMDGSEVYATCTVTVKDPVPEENPDWSVIYLGRNDFEESDGTVSRVEEFGFKYTGSNWFIVRSLQEGVLQDSYNGSLKDFFTAEAKAVVDAAKGDKWYENNVNVFDNQTNIVAFDMLFHGNYVTYMIEIDDQGNITGQYAKVSHQVLEEEAVVNFSRWIGTWRVGDGYAYYNIRISSAENNYFYVVDGWETGPSVTEQMNMDEDWIYTRYNKENGNMYFYGQFICAYNDYNLGDVDEMFVGTYINGTEGETVDGEGADYQWNIAHTVQTGETFSIEPENIEFYNGFKVPVKTIRYTRYAYKDKKWYHYNNAGVPTLPLTMTRIEVIQAPAKVHRLPNSPTVSRKNRNLGTLTVHIPKTKRSM